MRAVLPLVACPLLACLILAAMPARATAPLPQTAESFDVLLALPDGESRRFPALLTTPGARGPRPVLVIVPDEAGMDERTARLADLARSSGWIAVETDPEAASIDGSSIPPAPHPRRLAEWLNALVQVLADDPRADPNRIAVVGVGSGGRAALHAAARASAAEPAPAFAAHAALYPGCAALAAEGAARPEAPALVMLPGADESAAACADLAGGPSAVRRLEGATYAWDMPVGVSLNGRMRDWSGGGQAPIRPDPKAASAAEGELLRFLRGALGD